MHSTFACACTYSSTRRTREQKRTTLPRLYLGFVADDAFVTLTGSFPFFLSFLHFRDNVDDDVERETIYGLQIEMRIQIQIESAAAGLAFCRNRLHPSHIYLYTLEPEYLIRLNKRCRY